MHARGGGVGGASINQACINQVHVIHHAWPIQDLLLPSAAHTLTAA